MGSGTSKSKSKEKPRPAGQAAAPSPLAAKPAPPRPGPPTSNGNSGGGGSAHKHLAPSGSDQGGCVPYEHSPAPLPPNEQNRIGALCSLNVLDTEPESRFDELTKLCCMIFKVPIALVSLVDKERQWFKSVQGLGVTQTERRGSFCAWTLLPHHPEVLVVENALEDVRFQQNPLVQGDPNIRFYAGCPLVATDGARLGSLCVIDRKARPFDADQCTMLANFAEMVVREIEKEKMLEMQKAKSAQLSKENNQLLRAMDCFSEGILLCNLALYEWPILYMNEGWERITGLSKEDAVQRGFWEIFTMPEGQDDRMRAVFEQAIEQQQGFDMTVCMAEAVVPITNMSAYDSGGTIDVTSSSLPPIGSHQSSNAHASGGPTMSAAGVPPNKMWLKLQFRCASNDQVDSYMPLVGIPPQLGNAGAQDTDAPVYYFATLSPGGITEGKPHASAERREVTSSMLGGISSNSLSKLVTVVDKKVDPFDDVRLGPLLGRGAFGRVYRGQWNGAIVAVKVLEHTVPVDGGEVTEALVGGQVSHPNIVQTYKHCTRSLTGMCAEDEDGRPLLETWMVMEFCNKGALSDAVERGALRRRHSLFDPDWRSIMTSAREVASAMCYLHARNILHGDLTGNNVLLAAAEADYRKFVAKVADFGMSRALGNEEQIKTKTVGTITHMPPELLVDGILSKSADVFAFGMLMYEMVMGQRPYMGMSHGQIIHAITTGRMPQMGSVCPSALKKLVDRCLNKDPSQRPLFTEVLATLEDLEPEVVGL